MRLLLDTHVFLWFISGDDRLPNFMRKAIIDMKNEAYLSVVSLWEAIIKHQIGRLPLPESPWKYLPLQRERHKIMSLPIYESSVVNLEILPDIHRDPFDRMLICQAMNHDLTIVTVDNLIRKYTVGILSSPEQ